MIGPFNISGLNSQQAIEATTFSTIFCWSQQSKLLLTISLAISFMATGCSQGRQHFAQLAGEAADREAIKGLVDAYSHDADRRKADEQAALFSPNGEIEVFQGEPVKNNATALIKGRNELAAGFRTLKKYDVTMHFNGQSTIWLLGDSAKGETYCLAHHVWVENGQRMLMVMGIRYYDTFVRSDGKWFFAKRQLIFDWIDRKPSKP